VVFRFLLLEVALLNIEVQKLNYVLNEQQRINFVNLTGLSEISIFADINQSEVLGYPFHEFYVLLLHDSVLWRIIRQSGTPNYQTS